MYSATLLVHSWIRWVVIVLGVVAFVRALAAGKRGWSRGDDAAGLWFTIAFNLQFLIGLLLYLFISPNTTAAMHDFAGSMASAQVRFWLVEHPTGMIIALALAHIGRGRVRKAALDRKARQAAIFYGLSLVVILIAQPWPGLPYGRPLFRLH
jgi:hypothetical protein